MNSFLQIVVIPTIAFVLLFAGLAYAMWDEVLKSEMPIFAGFVALIVILLASFTLIWMGDKGGMYGSHDKTTKEQIKEVSDSDAMRFRGFLSSIVIIFFGFYLLYLFGFWGEYYPWLPYLLILIGVFLLWKTPRPRWMSKK